MAKSKTTKKTTAKKPASRTSKKKTTKKASTARKKTATKKKTPARKPVAKKAATKKKPVKKKTASKKAPARKTTKKPVTKKTTKKPVSKKKPVTKKTSKKTKKTAKKPSSKPAAKPTPSEKAKTSAADKAAIKAAATAEAARLKSARDAASRLAALAGLPAVKSNDFVEPVAQTKKRRLTKSPISPTNLKKYRDLLVQKRNEVAGDVSAIEGEALNPSRSGDLSSLPQHMADQGSDEFDQALSLGIAASQRRLLVEIDAALDRIDNGVYGICELTGSAIHKERLEATPWSRYSLEGARMADRGITRDH